MVQGPQQQQQQHQQQPNNPEIVTDPVQQLQLSQNLPQPKTQASSELLRDIDVIEAKYQKVKAENMEAHKEYAELEKSHRKLTKEHKELQTMHWKVCLEVKT